MEFYVLYYENGRGGIAVSIDDGDHVILANGKILYTHHTVWEECAEDYEDLLSPIQKEAVERARKAWEERKDVDEVISAFRRDRLKAERRTPQKGKPEKKIQVPEGALVVMSELERPR